MTTIFYTSFVTLFFAPSSVRALTRPRFLPSWIKGLPLGMQELWLMPSQLMSTWSGLLVQNAPAPGTPVPLLMPI